MPKDKPIKVGIAGLGRAGWRMHCKSIAERKTKFHIVAGCEAFPEYQQRFVERFSSPCYTSFEEFIQDPEIELVTIATRSIEHYDQVVQALKGGKHVYVEKPMCFTYAEAKKLKALSAKSKGNLYVGHNRRFDPEFLHVREIMSSGILGDIYRIELRRLYYQRRDDWQALITMGGGQLLNWGAHVIDHALQMLESPVKSMWSELKKIAAVGDAEDYLKIILTGKNKRIIDIEISGGAALSRPQYFILGTRGALEVTGNTIELKYLDPRKKLVSRKVKNVPMQSFGSPEALTWIEKTIPVKPKKTLTIWDELYTAIRKRTVFPVKLTQAVDVMRIIFEVKKGTAFAGKKK